MPKLSREVVAIRKGDDLRVDDAIRRRVLAEPETMEQFVDGRDGVAARRRHAADLNR
jgi:hypothetical protein